MSDTQADALSIVRLENQVQATITTPVLNFMVQAQELLTKVNAELNSLKNIGLLKKIFSTEKQRKLQEYALVCRLQEQVQACCLEGESSTAQLASKVATLQDKWNSLVLPELAPDSIEFVARTQQVQELRASIDGLAALVLKSQQAIEGLRLIKSSLSANQETSATLQSMQ